MKHTVKITLPALALTLLGACTDTDYDVTVPTPEIPFDVEMEAALSKYDVLGVYAEKAGVAMGVSIDPEALAAGKLQYSIAKTNYSQVEAPGAFTPAVLINDEGIYDMSGLASYIENASEAGLSVFGPALCSLTGLPEQYLLDRLAPTVISYEPKEPETGEFTVADFENDALGTSYPMTKGSVAIVEEDPDGESGHVLHIGSNTDKANQSFPTFTVTMPEGKTLAHIKYVGFDVKAPGSGGLYGSGLRLIIEGTTMSYGNCQSFGCSDNKWGRDLVKLVFDPAKFSAEDLAKSTFTMSIGSATGSGNYYIDNVIVKWEVAGDDNGMDCLVDFEGDAKGQAYPMTGNSTAVVVDDPEGKSGKVLQVGSAETPTSHSFPKLHIKLPEGLKLGNYDMMLFDMKTIKGQYGSGMRFTINGHTFVGDNAATYGAKEGGAWARGGIQLSFTDPTNAKRYMELTEEEKQLTEFDLEIGSATGSGFYYIDNITFKRTIVTEDIIVEKTDEEKAIIVQGELDKWVEALSGACASGVKDMIVYDEPFDNESAVFDWAKYIGDGYVAKAQKAYGDVAAEAGGEVRWFVSQSLVLGASTARDIEELAAEVAALEANGVKVDGVNLRLSCVFSENYSRQLDIESQAIEAVRALRALGKPVRISNFALSVTDRNNSVVNPATIGIEEHREIGRFYGKVIKEFRSALGDNAIAFSLSEVVETNTHVAPWAAGGNRNYIYEGLATSLSE